MARILANGIYLNVEIAGTDRASEPLVLLHGFTGSAATWSAHTTIFSQHFQTIAVDLLGHGLSDSPADAARYQMERCIDDLLSILDHLNVERANLLGYSMGGRVALHFAAAYPERLSALVLESASPGLHDAAERQARIASDHALADRLERNGLEAFIDYWTNLPLFASQSHLPADVRADLRSQRLGNNLTGLANSLRGLGTGAQQSLWDRLATIGVPTLLIAGALDEKFASIAQKMAQSMPHSRLAIVGNAGHAVHLERPALFDQLVLDYLTEIAPDPARQRREAHHVD